MAICTEMISASVFTTLIIGIKDLMATRNKQKFGSLDWQYFHKRKPFFDVIRLGSSYFM